MGNGSSKRDTKKIDLAERDAKWCDLRRLGHSYERIAKQAGVDRSTVHRAVVKRILEITREPAEAVKQQELERLDDWLVRLQKKIQAGDVQAIGMALRICERRSALEGLDAPKRTEAAGSAGEIPKIEIILTHESEPKT